MTKSNILYIASGILITSFLLCAAIVFPRVSTNYISSKMEQEYNTIDLHNVQTFTTNFIDFNDKLRTIAENAPDDTTLKLVSISEGVDTISTEDLKKSIIDELKILYSYYPSSEEIVDIQEIFKSFTLSNYQLMSLYSQDLSSPLNGIRIIKLVYNDNGYNMTVYIDQEYCKIYALYLTHPKLEEVTNCVDFNDGPTVTLFIDPNFGDYGIQFLSRLSMYYNIAAIPLVSRIDYPSDYILSYKGGCYVGDGNPYVVPDIDAYNYSYSNPYISENIGNESLTLSNIANSYNLNPPVLEIFTDFDLTCGKENFSLGIECLKKILQF